MLERLRQRLFWPFVLPAIVLYTVVLILPMVQTILYSFTDRSLKTKYSFVGFKNYINAVHDPFFWTSLQHTLIYTVLSLFMLFVPAIFLAWCLSQPIRIKRFFRFIIFTPVVISVLVTSLIWKFFLNPNWGLLNALLKAIGLESLATPWLGNTHTALLAVTVASVSHSIGMYVVLISAGLERIPTDMYDAAKVDGANDRQQFFHISLPLLWDVLRSLIVLWIIHAIQAFAWVFVMTQGGPMNSTEVAATYVYSIAFVSNKFGYSTALATLMMFVIIVITWLANRLNRRESYEF
ncbi:raffinose/stachyose/melibiose transport system permease protein [Paenibacillus sp. yr247]|uniref:carbohydrate ABC transporter permease n=1 Tax=Paenibacillus sp. yr247 TaxID=1761880 RepID=UPI0008898E49|nr:sugar ABC transporter permease [Paenibacillus sp. yr247]SDO38351.1 raffinose/stachyose/melibiose transport system permease protein [Paenibacillus sp. yr247]